MKITSISNSFKQLSRMTVCFGQFFSRHLYKHFKPKSPRKNDMHNTSLCYLVYWMMNL